MINANAFILSDSTTIQELMHIRDKNGKIEGQDGYHDDHSDALVLACWALRTCPGFDGRPKGSIRGRNKNPHPMQRIKQATR